MRLEAVLLAVMLSLSGPGLFAQTPLPPKPKPVEDVPPPDIGPGILAVPTQQTSAARTWAMFLDEPWPSEQALILLTAACATGHGGASVYSLGPNAQETIVLEKTVQELKSDAFFKQRKIVVVPIGSPQINAWDINGEDILYDRRQRPTGREAEHTSLICVPQGIIEFFLDAPEELETIIAHEMGHAVDAQCYLNARPKVLFPQQIQQICESRADVFALNTFLAQGKNPYAIAGAFGRLSMYLGDTSTGILARLSNFADDHPLTPDRIRNLRSILIEAIRTHQLQPVPVIR
ncbi:MAG TPA: hypothetical protein VHF01_13675 [Candidatus Acidoferrum sp.]|nr:hypothetical protein [Candidatus Acidoferrum sp.]